MMIDDPLAIARLRSVFVLVGPTVYWCLPRFSAFSGYLRAYHQHVGELHVHR
jgi:hypothetical protein